jgi:hypothetical protein
MREKGSRLAGGDRLGLIGWNNTPAMAQEKFSQIIVTETRLSYVGHTERY